MANYRGNQLREILAIAKALGDESRLRALCALRGRELCVCQITELLELAPSTVSKHMSILHQAGLLESRKEGRWVYYRLAGKDGPAEASEAVEWVLKSLLDDGRIREDAGRLCRILELDPEELCRRQSAS